MDVKDYEKIFADYFDKTDVLTPEFRGVPIRGGYKGNLDVHNCIGEPPTNCEKGYYCIGSTKQWACL